MRGRKISFETEQAILALHSLNKSNRKISEVLKEQGMNVSRSTVNNVINKSAEKKKKHKERPKKLKNRTKRTVRVKRLIAKVKKLISTANPPSQRKLSRDLGISLGTVNRIIHEDLGARTRRKTKTHSLSHAQVASVSSWVPAC